MVTVSVDALSELLEAWASAYPIMRRERIRPLSATLSQATPFLDVPGLMLTGQTSLWVFALDDVFDERLVTEAELDVVLKGCRSVACGVTTAQELSDIHVPEVAAFLVDPLVAICRELCRFPRFAALRSSWAHGLKGVLWGMTMEHRWSRDFRCHGAAALPSYEAYLEAGAASTSTPLYVSTMLIAVEDDSVLCHLAALEDMAGIAARCIRLANDLQTHRREMLEGKVNSLVILSHQFQRRGMPVLEAQAAAESRVRDEILSSLSTLRSLGATPNTATGDAEAAISNIAAVACKFYEQADYLQPRLV